MGFTEAGVKVAILLFFVAFGIMFVSGGLYLVALLLIDELNRRRRRRWPWRDK